jgi:hypothetical protein
MKRADAALIVAVCVLGGAAILCLWLANYLATR